MDDLPAWIQLLYARYNPHYALHTAFLHNSVKSQVAETADSQPEGRRQLRRVALSKLVSNDLKVVALSLIFLSVVGESNDLPAIADFMAHSSDVVQRAARACQYALEHLTRAQ